jgi:hypothetical protein
MGSLKAQSAVLTAGAVLLFSPTSALAEEPEPPAPPPTTSTVADEPVTPPPATPSISQYVETVPTSNGGASAGGSSRPRTRPLPPHITAKLGVNPRKVSKNLKAVATSSRFGAPQRDLPIASRAAGGRSDKSEAGSGLTAAVNAVSDSSDGHVWWLLVALIVVTTTIVLSTARPQTRQR